MHRPTRLPTSESYLHSGLACLHGCLRHIGVRVTPGWLFGVTGEAFLLPPPASSGVGVTGTAAPLVANVGAEIELVTAPHAVRAAIDAGAACFGLGPGGCHWVTGQDDEGYVCVGEGGADLPRAPVAVVRRTTPPDDVSAIRSGIQFALGRVDSGALEAWATTLEANAAQRLAIGPAHERRAYAVEFMWEAKERLRGRLAPLFNDAAEEYDRVARALRVASAVSGSPDAANVSQTAQALRRAGDAEARAIEALASIAASL